ncbi:hypothetical protein [Laceyella tengchongensis]|uniref:hypothetical protein n=1 Tax=Laceyella tengchongensis TaxID=574699 RepID=UPI0012B75124|nr:hypothetical protein [Laceyella tengchongensis]MRG28072.1 hypothetical protein [Laceyella tengchongensis]
MTKPAPQEKAEPAVHKPEESTKPTEKKPEAPKTNKNCEMKGEEFIQKSREERQAVITGCLLDYPQKEKVDDVQKVLDKANKYFTNSEAWEAPVTKFLDDYVAWKTSK